MIHLIGKVEESGEFSQAKELARFFASNINRKLVIDGKRWHPVRSNQQNRAVLGYWMSIILKELGYEEYEREAVYYAIKEKCWFQEHVCKETGQTFTFARKTSNLDTMEYKIFMETFRSFVRDFFNIHLPDPVKSLALI